MTFRGTQTSVSSGMMIDHKSFRDAGIPNPIILQMNYAQAIKRSPIEVAAAKAAAVKAAAAAASATNTTTRMSAQARVPHPIWTAARGRSDSCMSDVSDAGSVTSTPTSVSNSSTDSINQLPVHHPRTLRDSSPTPSATSEKSLSSHKGRSLGKTIG